MHPLRRGSEPLATFFQVTNNGLKLKKNDPMSSNMYARTRMPYKTKISKAIQLNVHYMVAKRTQLTI
jgi:hypothetical protein